ncbi:MAG: ABC transporter permease [Herbinix sp.]|nr:ABC transporter permease [Herbinix sp.]
MIASSLLISESISMLYTTSNAISQFEKDSNMADNIVISLSDDDYFTRMNDWATNNSLINNIDSENVLLVSAGDIAVPSDKDKLDNQTVYLMSEVPDNYNLVFSHKNKRFDLKDGEIALPVSINEKTGIDLEDKISISKGDFTKDFTVKYIVKDVVFGSSMMSMKRIFLNDNDFDYFNRSSAFTDKEIWSIKKNKDVDYSDIDKALSAASLNQGTPINGDTISLTYLMELLTAVIMIVVSILLIFISFLILRFTIVFTIEEDCKEIGIMKAIGLKNRTIKSIYMTKYFALSVIGGIIGFLLSVLFSDSLLNNLSKYLIMKTDIVNYAMSTISVAFIVALTVGYCFLCTRKINKLTAISAIRQGNTSGRMSISRKLKLHKTNHLSTPAFFAFNDLVVSFRKFIILFITFILGTILIIIPVNIINTLGSDEVIQFFGLSVTDFNIGDINVTQNYIGGGNISDLITDLLTIEERAKEKNVDITLFPEINENISIYTDNVDESLSIISFQGYDYAADNYTYLNGKAPQEEDEIAITSILADYFDVGIGDHVNCTIGDKTYSYKVTALFQSMINAGNSIRLSSKHKVDLKNCCTISIFGLINDTNVNKNDEIEILKREFPEYGIEDNKEYLESYIGNSIDQLGAIKNMVLILVMAINFLITSLLVQMLLTKEIHEVGVLKSIGYKNRYIRKWQVLRIAIILIISTISGTLVANFAGGFLTSGIFRMMGATEINLRIQPLEVFVIYPIIILVVTLIAVLVSLGQINRITIRDINGQE